MWSSIFIFSFLYYTINAETYNTYYGVPATDEEIAEFEEKDIADICTISFNPCDESELRRPDGSCNNLQHPSHGMYHTRQWRMLPAEYGENFGPRLTSSGEPFPLARYIRQKLVKTGIGFTEELTGAVPYFIEAVGTDIMSGHDVKNIFSGPTTCCEEESLRDPMCAPNLIPSDDFVHRFSDIRCHNNTKPITFQTTGCVDNTTVPARISYATAYFDLSQMYNAFGVSYNDIREFQGGRLKVEIIDGQSYPSAANENTTCNLEASALTGCTLDEGPNGLLGANLYIIWFWRLHNIIADTLAELNPCWSDEEIFRNAMDIVIAYYNHILFYEFFALIFGRENLIRDGILLPKAGFRDIYDETVLPQMAIEFPHALRWFHSRQQGHQPMYDEHDNYVGTTPYIDYIFGIQYLPFNNTMLNITHGAYMEHCAAFDNTAHPDMTDKGLGSFQKAFDILTGDLAKGRLHGLPSYTKYRDMCTDYTVTHETFEDLHYLMDPSKVDMLEKLYKDILNVELMAGMWSEKLMNGTWVTPTVYCLFQKQLKMIISYDRLWHENPYRPNAFTDEKMDQITKASFAGLLCTVGDKVTEIQPEAFRSIGPDNCKVSCSEIPQLDLTPWQDEKCTTTC